MYNRYIILELYKLDTYLYEMQAVLHCLILLDNNYVIST